MGVDCDICLPHNARVRDVADVLATLAGAPSYMRTLSNGGRSFEVFESEADIEIKSFEGVSMLYDCLDVYLKVPRGADWQFISGQPVINTMWFFNFNVGRSIGQGLRHAYDGRGLGGRSTAFWIAAARGLVNFFGGAADFNDCDNRDMNYSRPDALDLAAHDGDPYDAFQKRKRAVKPLTKADLAWAEKYAEYKAAGAMR